MHHDRKELILLRHGKSSWEDLTIPDMQRPLIPKGEKRTKLIASYMKKNNILPQLIISSPAKRTYDTALIIIDELQLEKNIIHTDDSLYFVNVEQYSAVVQKVDDNIQSVMIIGHNPMLTNFCNLFLTNKIDNLPTSGLCVLEFYTPSWANIFQCENKVLHIVFPKKLKDE